MSSLIPYNVVLDTNVVISALVFGGVPKQITDLVGLGDVLMYLSPELEQEIVRKFRTFMPSPEIYSDLQILIERYSKRIIPSRTIAKTRDPKDDMLLALCATVNANYLVSGDKDLLVLRRFNKTKIVTPRQFIREMARRNIFNPDTL